MRRCLEEMTLEELWRLFPIFLVESSAAWKKQFEEEKTTLSVLVDKRARISHIGSTAVDGIQAKNIVDILIEFPSDGDMPVAVNTLSENGWRVMSRGVCRVSLNKGYTEDGFADKVFHLHLRRFGDNDELYFRDYLREYPDVAKEYEALKLRLWKQFEFDRDGYTAAKGEFIKKYTDLARSKYKDRYQRTKNPLQ